jgi:hypothetical protein
MTLASGGHRGGKRGKGGFRLWKIIRRDIGRKLTAFIVAVVLWTTLANVLTEERLLQFNIQVVDTVAEADQERSRTPAVYLVVPPELIVRDMSPGRVRVDVKGLKDDVSDLDVSAVIVLQPDALGDQDEAVVPVLLDRDQFKGREREPSLSEFNINPPRIDVTLARKAEAELLLGPENVVVVGRPREGYAFDESSIRVTPNRVTIEGPSSAVDNLVANPGQLKLRAVSVEGRILEVSQQVDIDKEKVDRSVSLLTTGGVVEVSIPVRPRDITREVFSVPVSYENEDLLSIDKRRVVVTTETLDLLVTGPRPVLEGLTPEQLAERIRPVFDWSEVSLTLGDEKVRLYRDGLPDSVRITDLDGRPPEIHYRLETADSDANSGIDGESP